MNNKSIGKESSRVRTLAIENAGKGDDQWNERFYAEVKKAGFELVPIGKYDQLECNGLVIAPIPFPDSEFKYNYPSVVAPAGWIHNR